MLCSWIYETRKSLVTFCKPRDSRFFYAFVTIHDFVAAVNWALHHSPVPTVPIGPDGVLLKKGLLVSFVRVKVPPVTEVPVRPQIIELTLDCVKLQFKSN